MDSVLQSNKKERCSQKKTKESKYPSPIISKKKKKQQQREFKQKRHEPCDTARCITEQNPSSKLQRKRKKKKKPGVEDESNQQAEGSWVCDTGNASVSSGAIPPRTPRKDGNLSALQQKMMAKLQGGRFRFLFSEHKG